MFERIRKWQERSRDISEVYRIPDTDLTEMGFSRDELRTFVAMGTDHRDRQLAMAKRHGLEARDLRCHPKDLIASSKACASCDHTAECARYLASDAPAAASAAFCPNHEIYEQLA